MIAPLLVARGLGAPDGRLLHAYALTDAEFREIEATLRALSPRQKRMPAMAALYVLWASERIRTAYDGSGLSWEFINAPLPGIFEGTTIARFVRLGLDQWQRPLRRGLGGSRLFMYSLLAEGGLPLSVLESARKHAQVLREMIDDIGRRGGIAVLGLDTACALAQHKMRPLPNILKDRDSVLLFVDLAQAILDLREMVPSGLEGDQRLAWLDRERPDWHNSLPLRLTPQIVENIIRPSLVARHEGACPKSALALREIHLTPEGQALAVAIMASEASLPALALPGPEVAMLRLVPRFDTRRPMAYRAQRQADAPVREMERLGGLGAEVVALELTAGLEFDVLADGQNLGAWTALAPLPAPEEGPTLWAGQDMAGDRLRLRQMSGGRTRAPSLWVTLPKGVAPDLGEGLVMARRLEMRGASLVELQGVGHLRVAGQVLAISTGADSDSETATLFVFGPTLPTWRTRGGEPVYLGRPVLHGQKGEGAPLPLAGAHVRRLSRPASPWGAELCEWWAGDERLAWTRTFFLPAALRIDLRETQAGGLSIAITGLPEGVLIDLQAGALVANGRTGSGPLTLPLRSPETAFVDLTMTEVASGRRLELVAPWPSAQPLFIRAGAVLPPRDLDLSFDELAGISLLAPGSHCRMTVELGRERSVELLVSGLAPLVRHATLFRRLMVQGTADSTVRVSLHNSAGQTGRLVLRRYHGQMALYGDRLTLGHAADLPRGALVDPQQVPGRAVLHLLQVETGEEHELTAELGPEALDLRQASGIESGVWLVQGRFDGFQQRPKAWMATPPDPENPTQQTTRPRRIAAYRADLLAKAEQGGGQWRALLALILAAQDKGDASMLDQFHALAQAPLALARMVFALPAADLPRLFALDDQWNVFWPAFPLAELETVARDTLRGLTDSLESAGQTPAEAASLARRALVDRLALLRLLRGDIAGHVAHLVVRLNLLADMAKDRRFDGLLRAGFDDAMQVIARSDPALPRRIASLSPSKLPRPDAAFQTTVKIIVGTALATAEAALGLAPRLTDEMRLTAGLVEISAPDLFARALHPAMLLALTFSRS